MCSRGQTDEVILYIWNQLNVYLPALKSKPSRGGIWRRPTLEETAAEFHSWIPDAKMSFLPPIR
jgi:hypothetical protein